MIIDTLTSIGDLLEEMAATVVTQRGLPLDEVQGWSWERLERTYTAIGKQNWDDFVNRVQEVETGFGRVAGSLFGKKPKPLPTWEEAQRKSKRERQRKMHPFWEGYLQANNIESWKDSGVSKLLSQSDDDITSSA